MTAQIDGVRGCNDARRMRRRLAQGVPQARFRFMSGLEGSERGKTRLLFRNRLLLFHKDADDG